MRARSRERGAGRRNSVRQACRVNAIAPSVIRNPIFGGSPEEAETAMKGTPAGRSDPPEAIAHAAVYLASEEAAFVHGTIIDVDGGCGSIAVFATG